MKMKAIKMMQILISLEWSSLNNHLIEKQNKVNERINTKTNFINTN